LHKSLTYPNSVTPAKVGIQTVFLDSGLRRNGLNYFGHLIVRNCPQ
jgi:hypothetical protein